MNLYITRHGDADNAARDSERPLSELGRSEARRIAAFLGSIGVSVPAVWHSEKLRAKQTAEILARVVGGDLEERPGLTPNADAEALAAELRHWQAGDLYIVSHLPLVSILASNLVSGDASAAWAFETCGTACLEREATGRWWIKWFLTPSTLPELSDSIEARKDNKGEVN